MQNKGFYKSPEHLTELFDQIKETLPKLPGFRSLSLFGSVAEGRFDGYSDIDVIVTTDDLPGAKSQILGLLEQIGPIEFCWVINLRPDEWNPMVMFREKGYYHKLDLGLVDTSAENRTIPAEQTVILVDKPTVSTDAVKESGAYFPQHGSVGHFLLGQYIGCVRYVKARKRNQIMSCYRFASATVDWHLALRYAYLTGDTNYRWKLSTDEYKKIDEILSAEDRTVLLSNLDFSSLTAMDNTVLAVVEKMLEDAICLANMSGEVIPTAVFERIIDFITQELRLK